MFVGSVSRASIYTIFIRIVLSNSYVHVGDANVRSMQEYCLSVVLFRVEATCPSQSICHCSISTAQLNVFFIFCRMMRLQLRVILPFYSVVCF
jgi:hypothetical protein